MGVWIETANTARQYETSLVTPCMGVWIETMQIAPELFNCRVTPCMGVWIETPSKAENKRETSSHPVWVCGLKHKEIRIQTCFFPSHPVWVCGLKQSLSFLVVILLFVTPCMGVWIETQSLPLGTRIL